MKIMLEPTTKEAAQIEAAARELITTIRQSIEQMKSDQQEIDWLKKNTRAILARLKTA